jgi:hypothetical protein
VNINNNRIRATVVFRIRIRDQVLGFFILKLAQFFPISDGSGGDAAIVISPNASSHFQLICETNHMTAFLERAFLSKHVNVDRLYLRDRGCKAEWNSSHVVIKTSLSGCGTTFSKDHQNIFFSNVLSGESDSSAVGNSTKTYLRANMTCSYPRKRTVGSLSFAPVAPVKHELLASLGKFMSH